MKKFVIAALVFGGVSMKPQPAQADDWGCTILLCAASTTDPMQIPECATALLKIRPWKLPICRAAGVPDFTTTETGGTCPVGYVLGRSDIYIDEPDLRRTTRELVDVQPDGELRGGRRICIDPRNRRTAPLGNYDKGFTISYVDENGNPRTYSFKSAY